MLAQIKPHFMYNTLASIGSLINTDPTTAWQLLFHFSKYMRDNIDGFTTEELIPFPKELSHALTFVEITSICFQKEIYLELELETEDFFLPPLTLQPLVENAIKHGKLLQHAQGTIIVRSWVDNADVVVQVEDNGVGFDESVHTDKNGSVGLRNIEFRLEALCKGTLEMSSIPGKGTIVTLQIPIST